MFTLIKNLVTKALTSRNFSLAPCHLPTLTQFGKLAGDFIYFLTHDEAQSGAQIENILTVCQHPSFPRLCFGAHADLARLNQLTYDHLIQAKTDFIAAIRPPMSAAEFIDSWRMGEAVRPNPRGNPLSQPWQEVSCRQETRGIFARRPRAMYIRSISPIGIFSSRRTYKTSLSSHKTYETNITFAAREAISTLDELCFTMEHDEKFRAKCLAFKKRKLAFDDLNSKLKTKQSVANLVISRLVMYVELLETVPVGVCSEYLTKTEDGRSLVEEYNELVAHPEVKIPFSIRNRLTLLGQSNILDPSCDFRVPNA